MAKKVTGYVKLQIPAGEATPAPPVGPALGQHGVNIGEFVKRFNDATKKDAGLVIPCIVTVYKDRTFDMVYKTPPASVLLKKYANVVKGSGMPNKEKVGTVTRKHLEEIAKIKIKDMNAGSMDAAIKAIEGTARNMGIKVEG